MASNTGRAGGSVREYRAPEKARAGIHRLERLVEKVPAGSAEVTVVHQGDSAVLDPVLVDALRVISRALDAGDQVTVLVGSDDEMELSSQEAADLLNVSRPHVVKLAATGVLPHRKVGNRHRFSRGDVLAYAELAASRRGQALAELAPAGG